MALQYLVAPASPPQIDRVRSDRPPGRLPHLPASTARLCFPPSPGGHKEFLTLDCICSPSSGFPPFVVLDLCPGHCQLQGFSHMRVPSSLCLHPSPARLLPPLSTSTGDPVPCHSRRASTMLFCPPSIVRHPPPSPCSAPSFCVF